METRLKTVLYTLQDKITLLNEIVREEGRSSRLAREDLRRWLKKKKIMDGDSGKIEFERETRGCKPFKVLYNVILEYQSRNHFSKLKTTLRSIVYPIVSTLK